MIDKKISLGTIVTILTIGGTIFFTQGSAQQKVESIKDETDKNLESIDRLREDVNQNKVAIGKIEAKIDEGFKRLETLIIEN
tara:strand:+ start:538 stop:783 length:246 start_codon:yes stop_codon:yes gene_type:complete